MILFNNRFITFFLLTRLVPSKVGASLIPSEDLISFAEVSGLVSSDAAVAAGLDPS